MNPRPRFATLKQLIRDTFRQSSASGIFWMMLAVTGLCVLLCLSVKVSGDAPIYAKDEQGYFQPSKSPRDFAPSVVLVLGSSGSLDALTRTAVSGRQVWFSLAVNPSLAKSEGIETLSSAARQ